MVAVQETWAGRPGPNSLARSHQELELWFNDATAAHGTPNYLAFWGDNTSDPSCHAGVAFLVHPRAGMEVGPFLHDPGGRVAALHVSWGGHRFWLVSTYWPASGPAARGAYVATSLSPFLSSLPLESPIVICGDFNFTVEPAVDRRPFCPATAAADRASTTAAAPLLSGSVDLFRHRHPTGRAFTLRRNTAVARLDRLYAPLALAAFVDASGVACSPHGDHNVAYASLLPATPLQPRGPGRRRVPPSVTCDPALLAAWAARAVAHASTLGDDELVAWWPHCKVAYSAFARSLAADVAAARAAAAAPAAAAQAAVGEALAAVAASPHADLPSALAGAACARAALRRTAAAAAAPGVVTGRARWLHANETPCPAITTLLRPSGHPATVPALRSAGDGPIITTNDGIAERFATHFASISVAPAADPAAQARVLGALQAAVADGSARCLDPEAAAAAGSPAVSVQEVARTMASVPTASAPGPDGLPYELWTVRASPHDEDGEPPPPVWAPLLARLFSAVTAVGALPAGFNLGTITALPKPDSPDVTSPASYRPITLLNADYRILTRVLAKRYAVAMSPAIGLEQSAFLPGRRIETTILTAFLAHDALVVEGGTAVAALLDIAKAYDTVSRPFLFSAMETLGASPGMLGWARILLSDTAATAHANGVESRAYMWDAGVRQGCPLSPVLYLFVAQALTTWLRAQPPLGIIVGGCRHVSAQFADDTTAFLRTGPAPLTPASSAATSPVAPTVPDEGAFLEALDTFAAASNQRVSLPKSRAVLIGAWPSDGPRPTTVAGMPVVAAARLLGVPFAPVGPSPGSTCAPDRPYSTRAALRPAVTAPPPTHPFAADMWSSRLNAATAILRRVARLPLSAMGHGLAASAYAISTALYALELGDAPPTAVAELHAAALGVAPAHIPRRLLPGSPRVGGFGFLPLRSHVLARHAAMALRLLSHLLPPASQPDDAVAPLPEVPVPPHAQLAAVVLRRACPALHPAQTLLAFTEVSATAADAGVLAVPGVSQEVALPPGFLRRAAAALSALGPLALISGADLTPAQPALQPAAIRRGRLLARDISEVALRTVVASLAWARPPTPPVGAAPPPLSPLAHPSVRAVTTTLEADTVAYRAARHLAFLRDALAAPSLPRSSPDVAAFASALASAWRLRMDNRVKEPHWRLAVDAFPGARFRNWTCPCGTASAASRGRRHSFWDCPVAGAVRQQLTSPAVPGGPVADALRAHVWLLRPPPGYARQPHLWTRVALVAVAAMEHGRCVLWARSVAGEHDVVLAAGRLAAARFWALLEEVGDSPALR